MYSIKENLEREANSRILEDIKELLSKYTPEFLGTDALLYLSELGDKLVVREILNRNPDLKKSDCVYCGDSIISTENRCMCDKCHYERAYLGLVTSG